MGGGWHHGPTTLTPGSHLCSRSSQPPMGVIQTEERGRDRGFRPPPPPPPSAQPSPFFSFHEFRGSSGRGMQPTCGSAVHPEGSVPHLDLGWPQFKGQELQVYSLVPLADLSGGGLWGSRTQVVAGDISVNTSHCMSLQVPERERRHPQTGAWRKREKGLFKEQFEDKQGGL